MRDEILVRQAAPTLSGIKSGSLFPCPLESRRQLLSDIRCRNRILRPKGLRLLPLRVSRSTVLLYLYRPSLLARDLSAGACIRLLARQGYPVSGGPLCCLAHLTRKLRQGGPFPHEIGLFLGYPPEDVQGFLDHHADGYQYAGLWKVYGNVTAAKARFRRYRACTSRLCRRFRLGAGLESLAQPDYTREIRQSSDSAGSSSRASSSS